MLKLIRKRYQRDFLLGKIINFSGWLLPVQYQEAIAASHQHTRTFASLFDVGHMMQTLVFGKDATELLESLTTGDLKNLSKGSAILTVFTNENGGILDDLIITKDDDDKYFLVSNAARRNQDSQLLLQQQVDNGILCMSLLNVFVAFVISKVKRNAIAVDKYDR